MSVSAAARTADVFLINSGQQWISEEQRTRIDQAFIPAGCINPLVLAIQNTNAS